MQPHISIFFFFNDTATTEIYTLSLHDALPICFFVESVCNLRTTTSAERINITIKSAPKYRSEEHTSELQSPDHLVCRLLLEKKKKSSATSHLCDTARKTVVQIRSINSAYYSND